MDKWCSWCRWNKSTWRTSIIVSYIFSSLFLFLFCLCPTRTHTTGHQPNWQNKQKKTNKLFFFLNTTSINCASSLYFYSFVDVNFFLSFFCSSIFMCVCLVIITFFLFLISCLFIFFFNCSSFFLLSSLIYPCVVGIVCLV